MGLTFFQAHKGTINSWSNGDFCRKELNSPIKSTQSKWDLQQHCKLLFNQKQTCSSTANYFSAKNKLAAALQTTFQPKTNLQQHCKLLFSQKAKNKLAAALQTTFQPKNKLAAALQTTFHHKTNLQQHCKPLFN